ncbi:MAG: PEP-CTERM system TPR-repeat protein PrsT [Gammaproteobacteria bacterium]|nr:PEP-CTERM system TPR-repeat protein PrsT [Gammaproteobacteria bacterium]
MEILSIKGKNLMRGLHAGLLFAIMGCSDPVEEAQGLTTKAQQYIKGGEIRAASIELKNALQLNPDNVDARFLLAKVNLDLGHPEAAEKELNRAISLGLSEENSVILLAEALLQQGAYQRLIDEFSIESVEDKETHANLLAIRAIAYSGLGQIEKANQSLRDAVAIFQDARWVMLARTKQLIAIGDMDAADEVLQRGLTLFPSAQDFWLTQAVIAENKKNMAGVARALKKVIELDSAHTMSAYGWQARIGQVKMALSQNELKKAQKLLDPLIKQNEKHPEVNYLAGLIAFQEHNYERAEMKLLQVLKVVPDHAHSAFLLGSIHYKKLNFEQALHYLSGYVATKPGDIKARKLLGQTYMALGLPKEAEAVLKSDVSDVLDPEVIALIGLSELQGGDKDKGIESLKRARQAAPDSATLRVTLARAYISNGQTKAAIRELDPLTDHPEFGKGAEMLQVLAYLWAGDIDKAATLATALKEKRPEDAAVSAMLARVYQARDDVKNSRRYLQEAIALKPDYATAIMALAQLEERQDDLVAARQYYKQVVELLGTAPAMYALARISEKSGNVPEMGEWLEKTAKADPDELLPQVTLAEYYMAQNKVEKAERIVRQLLKSHAQHPATLSLQGRMHMIKKQYNQALTPLQALVKVAPDEPMGHRLLGETWLALKEYQQASVSFEQVIKIEPNNLIALNNLAWHYDRVGDERALEYAEKAYQISRNNPGVQDTLGWILVKNDDIERGYALLKKASAALPNIASVQYHFAAAKIKRGEKTEGEAMLRALLASKAKFEDRRLAQKLLDGGL